MNTEKDKTAAPEPSFITREQAAADRVTLGPYKISPAAPTPLPWDAEDQFLATGHPAAPEPSACLVTAMAPDELARRMLAAESENRDLRDQLEGLRHNQRRAESTCEARLATKQRAVESAEAQLAAVRRWVDGCPDNRPVWQHCQALKAIRSLLTPAPSPGAGEKT